MMADEEADEEASSLPPPTTSVLLESLPDNCKEMIAQVDPQVSHLVPASVMYVCC